MKILTFDQSRCNRCGACQIVCSLMKKGSFRPEASRIRIESAGEIKSESLTKVNGPALRAVVCQHCAQPVCETACMRGIIHKDPETGVVSRQYEDCFRCASCQVLCPVGAAVEDADLHAFVTCDLCGLAATDGEDPDKVPACVGVCPTGALRYEEPAAASFTLREQYACRMLGEPEEAVLDWKKLSRKVKECTGRMVDPSTLAAWSEELRQAADEEVL